MAGYIGSKAVTLSTTAADVAGNAVIDGDLTVKGTTVTIDSAAVQEIRLGDNDKMTFGDATGGDLQIYHDGSNSYIDDAGTGNLTIRANQINFDKYTGEAMARFRADGNTELFYDNAAKLATTSTGIDVTGTVTADGLTVSAASPNIDVSDTGTSYASQDFLTNSSAVRATIGVERSAGGGLFVGSSPYAAVFGTASAGNTQFATNNNVRMTLDSSGNVGINESSPDTKLHVSNNASQTPIATIENTAHHEATIRFKSAHSAASDFRVGASISASNNFEIYSVDAATARLAIDSTGNVTVGTLDDQPPTNNDANGIALRADGKIAASRSNGISGDFNTGVDGDIIWFRKAGAVVGSIKTFNNTVQYGGAGAAIYLDTAAFLPANTGGRTHNTIAIGSGTYKFTDIYATNGTIQTSDQNEKQQIASLTDAEITAAKAISKLFKTFKWNDAVTEKGDAARTHTGVIAQEVEQAVTDAGLDAGDYAFFISTTWWETQTEVPAVEADEENGVEAKEAYTRTDTYETVEEAPEGATERNSKGIRYPELLSFIGAATEQRLASIESRLDALEGN